MPDLGEPQMKPQAEIVEEIDKTSTQDSELGSVSVASLIFLPPALLFKELIFKGGLFRGVAGVKQAVNASVLCFVTLAKRYERGFKNTSEMEKDSKDFM